MKGLESVRSKPMVRKGLIAVGVAVLVYTLFGFLALPPILKSVLSKTLSETLHRKAAIREVRVNPLELSATIRGLSISERDAPGTWVSFEEVFANLQLASVVRGGPVLSEIRLYRPYVNIARRPDGSYNFTDLIEEFITIRKKRVEESSQLKYSFNNIQVIDGSIDFDDGPKKTHHGVRRIQVAVPFLSNLKYYVDQYVQPSFAAVVNGKPVGFKGKTKPFSESLESVFEVNICEPRHPALPRIRPVAAGVRDPLRLPGREGGRYLHAAQGQAAHPHCGRGRDIERCPRFGEGQTPHGPPSLGEGGDLSVGPRSTRFPPDVPPGAGPRNRCLHRSEWEVEPFIFTPQKTKGKLGRGKGGNGRSERGAGCKGPEIHRRFHPPVRREGAVRRRLQGNALQDFIGGTPGRRGRAQHRGGEEGRRPDLLFDRIGGDTGPQGKPVPVPSWLGRDCRPCERWS